MKKLRQLAHFDNLKKLSSGRLISSSLIFIFLLAFYGILYKLYIQHILSFGCFDECMNYLGGYFLLHGRTLFSQIFFNHQPLMAYMSWMILKVFHPSNLFDILTRYKQFLLLFSLIANFFIIKKFKWVGVGFVIIFELSKYYLFGDKFLAESFIVYPLVYLIGLTTSSFLHQKLSSTDYIVAGIFAWFVIFSREPFFLIALGLLITSIGFPKTIYQKIGYGIFLVLSFLTIVTLPLKAYLYQVLTINAQGVGAADVQSTNLFGWGLFHVFLFPLTVFWGGVWNEYRILLVAVALVFCMTSIYLLFKKKFSLVFLSWFFLGLANLRPVVPGQVFYGSFHFIPYWGMFLLVTFLFLGQLYTKRLLFFLGNSILIVGVVSYIFLSKGFIWYRVDQQAEFVINYGKSYEIGVVISNLSNKTNTFFIDNKDSVAISYLIAQRDSSYAYGEYGFVAPNYPIFQQAYAAMWVKNPPDFYYGSLLPKHVQSLYNNIPQEGKPSLLYVKKSVISAIPGIAWDNVKQFGYAHP